MVVDAAVAVTDDNKAIEHEVGASSESVSLSPSQADKVHQVSCTIAALEATIDSLTSIGSVRGQQCLEEELNKEKRKRRLLIHESPAVADAFLQRRKAEDQQILTRRRLA